jgi:hypothetical protein
VQKIFSKIDSKIELAIHMKCIDVNHKTNILTNSADPIQINVRKIDEGFKLDPHKHLYLERNGFNYTHEIWILINGVLMASIYDLDNSLLAEIEMSSGDLMLYKNGGHSFRVMNESCILYEIKNGPYFGSELDKVNIDVNDYS